MKEKEGKGLLERLKTPLIPAVLIVLLLGLYFTRWDKEVSLKPIDAIQTIYQKDRWTGQRWVINYVGNNVMELPVLDGYLLNKYIESVRNRPDVIQLHNNKINDAKEKIEKFQPPQLTRFLSPMDLETSFKTHLMERVEKEIYQLCVDTAKIDMGNKAWAKRKYYYWAWDGLMALSVLWLLTALFLKKKNTGAGWGPAGGTGRNVN